MKKDWKGRNDEGVALDGSYIAARLGNWSASLGQQERWWGPGWDGSLILSTNARPIPAVSFDRRVPEPFETNGCPGSDLGVSLPSLAEWKRKELLQIHIYGESEGK